jgi:lipoyl(octanoyl) transferase
MQKVVFQDLGDMAYKPAWDYQEELFDGIVKQKVANRKLPESEQVETTDYLLFVEHPPVFTLGKSGDEQNMLIHADFLKKIEATYPDRKNEQQ